MLQALLTCYVLLIAPQPHEARVGGTTWYHSTNLLKNPSASTSGLSPWSQTGTWSVATGPVSIGSLTMNSPDGTPWFLNASSASANSTCGTCGAGVNVSLSQIVDLSPYANTLHCCSTGITYGGDAFGEGRHSGSGTPGYYHAQASYQASYTVQFYDANGNLLVSDTSGYVFSGPNFGCILPTVVRQTPGYRRTVSGIPEAARSVRFTASFENKLSVCYNNATSAGFRNGFDNLYLDFGYLGPPTAAFKAGPLPQHPIPLKPKS